MWLISEQAGRINSGNRFMIKNIKFPSVAGKLAPALIERYYTVYYTYVLNTAKAAGINVEMVGDTSVGDARFLINVDGRDILLDYSDTTSVLGGFKSTPYFKFHSSDGIHEPSIFPFPPISFYNWQQYSIISRKYKYNSHNELILCRQKPYGNATERRKKVQAMLKKEYSQKCHIGLLKQADYWKDVSTCLIHVFVPGYRNNMLDRGHNQYLGLGCCTISPRIINRLPFNKKMIPGVHYLECAPDYSDLLSIIDWCRINRNKCTQIGNNAKKLFIESCTPVNIWKWVEQCMNVGNQ